MPYQEKANLRIDFSFVVPTGQSSNPLWGIYSLWFVFKGAHECFAIEPYDGFRGGCETGAII